MIGGTTKKTIVNDVYYSNNLPHESQFAIIANKRFLKG